MPDNYECFVILVLLIVIVYCYWCHSQIYALMTTLVLTGCMLKLVLQFRMIQYSKKTHPLLLSANPAPLLFLYTEQRYGGLQHLKTAALISGVLGRIMWDHVERIAELMMDEALGGTHLLTLSAPDIDLLWMNGVHHSITIHLHYSLEAESLQNHMHIFMWRKSWIANNSRSWARRETLMLIALNEST